MLESEIKFDLGDRKSLDKLHDYLLRSVAGAPEVVSQVNHYLDTQDLKLADALVMLRLRTGKGTTYLTYKSGTEVERGFFRSREVESEITETQAAGILKTPSAVYELNLPPVGQLRGEFGVLPLGVIGCVLNERRRFFLEGYVVELDRIQFPGPLASEEYELEIESEDPAAAREWCHKLFKGAGVSAVPSSETKFQRLLRTMRP